MLWVENHQHTFLFWRADARRRRHTSVNLNHSDFFCLRAGTLFPSNLRQLPELGGIEVPLHYNLTCKMKRSTPAEKSHSLANVKIVESTPASVPSTNQFGTSDPTTDAGLVYTMSGTIKRGFTRFSRIFVAIKTATRASDEGGSLPWYAMLLIALSIACLCCPIMYFVWRRKNLKREFYVSFPFILFQLFR